MKNVEMRSSVENKNRKYGCILFLCSFCFYGFVMYCGPFSSDDLEYAIHQRTDFREALNFVLYYGNGRVLGNLGALYLCANQLLRVLVKAFAISAVIALLPAAIGKYSPANHLLSFLLLTAMSGPLFAQVYVWTSGFQNYVPPVLLSLVAVCCLRRTWNASGSRFEALTAVIIFAAGVAGQLFVEISTVINCLLALCVAVTAYRRWQPGRWLSVCWLVGTVIGAGIMAAVPELFSVGENWNVSYRSAGASGLQELLYTVIVNAGKLCSYYMQNAVICGSVCLCAYDALKRLEKVHKSRVVTAGKILVWSSLLYVLVNHFVTDGMWYGHLSVIRNMLTAVFFVIPLLILVLCVLRDEDRQGKGVQLLLGLAVMALLPLLVVNPVSMRCVFHSYVFAAAAMICYVNTRVVLSAETAERIHCGLASAAAVLALAISLMFANILWLSGVRDDYIAYKMARGAEEIVIFPIPYDYVLWDGTNIYRFEYYYSEIGDIEFTAIPYEDWSWMYGTENGL